jgi:hypothetical protein
VTSSPTTTSGVSTFYLTVIDPDDATHFRTVNLGNYTSASLPGYTYDYYSGSSYYLDTGYSYYDQVDQAIAPDGTVYLDVTTATGQYGVISVDRTLTVKSNPISVPGNSAYQRVVGPDGTSYQLSYTYVANQGYTVNAVTVIDPDDPTHATSINLPGYPQGGLVRIADDGTAYLYMGYDYVSGVGYRTKIMVFDPSDPYHPTVVEVPGYASGSYDIVADDDGSALVVTNDGAAKLVRIDTASSYQPPVQP